MDAASEPIDELEGDSAPPRKNGELVFEAPWESRAFGMALALHGQGVYRWEEFSARLAAEIAAGDRGEPAAHILPVPPDAEFTYYARWLAALEHLLLDKGLVADEELDERTTEFADGLWDDH